jgi:hypothetical protein
MVIRVAELQALFQQQFAALSVDKQRFHTAMRGCFGEGYDARKAERLRLRARSGDFGWLPQAKWVDPEILEGSSGAYYAELGTVFLSRAIQRAPALAVEAFIEQVGHILDAQLCPRGSSEDRGAVFRRLLGSLDLQPVQAS